MSLVVISVRHHEERCFARLTYPFGIADQISQVANLSHPVNATVNRDSIDISMSSIALDRDIILDIDLPDNRASTLVSVEKDPTTETHGILLSFTPRLSDLIKVADAFNETNTEFIFIGRFETALSCITTLILFFLAL